MADDRIPITYVLDPKTGDIHRKRGKGNEEIEDKIVAKYDTATQKLTFPNANYLRNFSVGVTTFLSENELTVRDLERGDLPPDKPLAKNVPPRPKKNKFDGDKTPAVVQWYFDHKPNQFRTRYKVIGTFTGKVSLLEPQWRARPVDGLPEYRGEARVEREVVNAMIATRAVCGLAPDGKSEGPRLTYLPEECVGYNEDDSELDESDRPSGAVATRAIATSGGGEGED